MSWKETDPVSLWKSSTVVPLSEEDRKKQKQNAENDEWVEKTR